MALNLRDPNSYTEEELLGLTPSEDGGRASTRAPEDFDIGMARENAIRNDANAQGYYEVGENAGGRAGLQAAISKSAEAQSRGIKTVEDYYRYTRGGDGSSFETVGGKEYYKGDGKTSNNFDMGLAAADPLGSLVLGSIIMLGTAGTLGPALGGLGAIGQGAGVGAVAGGINAAATGGDIGKGILLGGAAGGVGGAVGSVLPSDLNPMAAGAVKGAASSAAVGGNPLIGAAGGAAGAGISDLVSSASPSANAGGDMTYAASAGDAGASGMSTTVTPALPDTVASASDAIEAGVRAMEATGAQNFNAAAQKLGYGSYTEMAGSINPDWVSGAAALASQKEDKTGVSQEDLVKRIQDGESSITPEKTYTAEAPSSVTPSDAARMEDIAGGDTVLGSPGDGGLGASPDGSGVFDGITKWAKNLSPLVAATGVSVAGGLIKGMMSPSQEETAKAVADAKVQAEKQLADSIRANNNLSFLTLGRLKPTGKTLRKAGELPPGIINRARAQ